MPVQIRYNLPIEALYTFAPVIIVAVFFFHTVTSQNEMLEKVKNPDHTIEVVGSKWQWGFNYLEENAVDGDSVSAHLGQDRAHRAGTSRTSAVDMPHPAHIAATPVPPPRRRSSWMSEIVMRAPVIAIGWPRLHPLPRTLIRSS